jgi:hypothetical protein
MFEQEEIGECKIRRVRMVCEELETIFVTKIPTFWSM